MKHKIEELLFPFNDYGGRLFDLQHNLNPMQITIPNKFYKFILSSNPTIEFSNDFNLILKELYIFKWSDFDYRTINYKRDFSYRLQLRQNFLKICLFEDEEYTFGLSVNTTPLAGQWNIDPLTNDFSGLSFSGFNLKNLNINSLNLTLHRPLKKSNLHLLAEEELSIDRTWEECWQTFNSLILNPHYINSHFNFFQERLAYFKIIKTSFTEPSQLLKHLQNISKENLNHLDFFDWGELLFCFSILGNFTKIKRAYRWQALNKINHLNIGKIWTFSPSSPLLKTSI